MSGPFSFRSKTSRLPAKPKHEPQPKKVEEVKAATPNWPPAPKFRFAPSKRDRRGNHKDRDRVPDEHRRFRTVSFTLSNVESAYIQNWIARAGYQRADFLRRAAFFAMGHRYPLSHESNWEKEIGPLGPPESEAQIVEE